MPDLSALLRFLSELEKRKIAYRLDHNREDALMVHIAVPGERWEVEFSSDDIWIEVFTAPAGVTSVSLEELLRRLIPHSG